MMATPDLYLSFKKIWRTFGTAFEDETLDRLYNDLSPGSFSDDVLRHGVNLGVLPVVGVQWNDLGEPHRVLKHWTVWESGKHGRVALRRYLVG